MTWYPKEDFLWDKGLEEQLQITIDSCRLHYTNEEIYNYLDLCTELGVIAGHHKTSVKLPRTGRNVTL